MSNLLNIEVHCRAWVASHPDRVVNWELWLTAAIQHHGRLSCCITISLGKDPSSVFEVRFPLNA